VIDEARDVAAHFCVADPPAVDGKQPDVAAHLVGRFAARLSRAVIFSPA